MGAAMTAAITINGLTVPIKEGTFQETPREIGEQTVAIDGTQRRTRITSKRDCGFGTYAMPVATAYAWDMLLRGFGETWSFNASLYGSKGTGPNSSTGASVSADSPQFGANSLKLLAGGTNQITYALAASVWTVSFWRKLEGSSYHSYIITSTGKKWVDGVRNDGASTTFHTGSTTAQSFTDHATLKTYIDDFVWLPFEVPTDWPPVWGVESVIPFSLLPSLTMAGQAVSEASSRSVMGSVSQSPKFYAYAGGSIGLHQELTVDLIGV